MLLVFFFIIHAKEDVNGDHDYATYKHVLNFDEDKEKFYCGKNIKPFAPSLKTKSFTEPVNTMQKIEKRGGARKVEAVITENSTMVETNRAVAEHIEKYNEAVEIVNDIAAELAELKAQNEAMKAKHEAEMAQLRAMFSSNRGSIFSRPTATAKQEALSELETLKTQFDIDSEIERL